MTEEIKEKLDLFKYCVEKNEYLEVANMKEWKPLLNYITNLQKDYERIYNENCKLREQHNINDISLLDELQDYKQRNEKAVEYIENHTENIDRGTYYEDYVETYNLLNILKGGDE